MASPMSASALVTVLRAEGVIVKTPRSGWATHERDDETGKTFGPVNGVLIHHTAGHGDFNVVYDGNSSLPGPRAHVYINKAGEALMCSAGRANHAGGGDPNVLQEVINESYGTKPSATHYHEGSAGAADGNDHFYGFECENLGDGKDPWPHVQYVAMVKATVAIIRHYGWTEKSCIGHLEWSDWKPDPRGFTMAQFRADVKAALALPAGKWQATPSDNNTGGSTVALSGDDIHNIFYADIVPAQEPPYNNSDWEKGNKTWTFKYTLYTIVRSVRDATAKLTAILDDTASIKSSLGSISSTGLTDAQMDALADKVADKLAARLKD